VTDEAFVAGLLRAAGLPSGTAVSAIGHGESGDLVLRIGADPLLVAKAVGPGETRRAEFEREAAALAWLDGRFGAPKSVWRGEAQGRPALVVTAIPGVALHEVPPEEAESAAIAAIERLAELHALPIGDCPFDERLAVKLATAARRIAAGAFGPDHVEPHNVGKPPETLLADLTRMRPADEDLVVTHGDACWPNFILRPDGRVGIVDLGRMGVADRYQDLALFVRSGQRNAADLDLPTLLRRHYPLAQLDDAKLEFYRELDELF
jgi:aminoglycoside phosphotransferase